MITLPEELTGSKGKLIAATIELMAARGYESTSVQEILDAAQVTKSNFYYHFKSKEELCLAALDVMKAGFFKTVMEPILLNTDLSPCMRFKALFDMFLTKMELEQCQRGCPFTNLAAETSDFYPEFRESLANFHDRKAKFIEDCFREGVEKGEFRDDISPAEASKMMIALANGSLTLAKTYKSTGIIRENMSMLFKLFEKS